MRTLDRTDRAIINLLQRDSDSTVERIADQVGLSATPCWRRIQRLKREGVIVRTVAIVAPDSVDRDLTVFVSIETGDHSPDWRHRFAQYVLAQDEVMEVHRLAGAVDYLLKVAVRDMPGYDRFYRALTRAVPVKNISSVFVMERLKEDSARLVDALPDTDRPGRGAKEHAPGTAPLAASSTPEERGAL